MTRMTSWVARRGYPGRLVGWGLGGRNCPEETAIDVTKIKETSWGRGRGGYRRDCHWGGRKHPDSDDCSG